MKDRVFVDTNIWIYALTESKVEDNKEKREISLSLLESIVAQEKAIYASVQVINECHWNFIRKFNLSDATAIRIIQENIIAIFQITTVTLNTYLLSNRIRQPYCLSFWDSLIVASALENQCSILYTEDMQNGQVIEDKLRIVNPFKEKDSRSC
ncbi:MAG: PIN domain-containing protein [Desulfurobacteriaceae bacterium]